MTLSLTLETIDAARASGLDDLIQLHWEEVETDQRQVALDVDWPGYYRLERAGVLKPLMLRLDGALIGYSVWFVQPTLHHRSTVTAIADLIYVDPAHRGRAGIALIRRGEKMLREMGARVLLYEVMPSDLGDDSARARLAPLLRTLGYRKVAEGWAKYV